MKIYKAYVQGIELTPGYITTAVGLNRAVKQIFNTLDTGTPHGYNGWYFRHYTSMGLKKFKMKDVEVKVFTFSKGKVILYSEIERMRKKELITNKLK